jgi:hypothetical protein
MRAHDFTAYFTVGPGTYHVCVKLAEICDIKPERRALTILINGREVVTDVDVAATAGGLRRAVDLVFNNVKPSHGVIAVRFKAREEGHAVAQAVEIGPGSGGEGAKPVCLGTDRVGSETDREP